MKSRILSRREVSQPGWPQVIPRMSAEAGPDCERADYLGHMGHGTDFR